MAISVPQPPQVPEAPSTDSVSCYRVVAATAIASQAQAIARVLLAIGKASSADAMCWLTPDRRRIGYAAGGTMFQSGSATGLPTSAEDAESQARQFVQRVNTALGKDGTLAALKTAALLPADLRLLNATPVYHPGDLNIDHWLCRFLPTQRSRWSAPPAPVSEATVEVRVGADGRMLGLTAQWSPVVQEMLCSPIAPPDPRELGWTAQAHERAAVDATDVSDSGGAHLVYALVQAASGEAWLLPCYVFAEDPLQRRYPAAQHQLNELLGTVG